MTSTQGSRQKGKPAPRLLSILYRGLCWVCAVLAVLTVVLAVMGVFGDGRWEAIGAVVTALILGSFGGCFGAVRYSRLTASGSGKSDDEPGTGDAR